MQLSKTTRYECGPYEIHTYRIVDDLGITVYRIREHSGNGWHKFHKGREVYFSIVDDNYNMYATMEEALTKLGLKQDADGSVTHLTKQVNVLGT